MSVVEPGAGAGLVGRIKAILLRPSQTWDVIEAEPANISDLFKFYVAPLAAVPAVCGLVGVLMFGDGVMDVAYRPGFVAAVAEAVVSYVLTLAGVYILARVVDGLAPNFGGVRDPLQAFKVAAYAGTAAWVAGVFNLIPVLGWLAGMIGGLYSLYLLYLGLPKLMKAPTERVLSYFATVLVLTVIVWIVIGAITSQIRDHGGPLRMTQGSSVQTA
jgi:hypothetical protein